MATGFGAYLRAFAGNSKDDDAGLDAGPEEASAQTFQDTGPPDIADPDKALTFSALARAILAGDHDPPEPATGQNAGLVLADDSETQDFDDPWPDLAADTAVKNDLLLLAFSPLSASDTSDDGGTDADMLDLADLDWMAIEAQQRGDADALTNIERLVAALGVDDMGEEDENLFALNDAALDPYDELELSQAILVERLEGSGDEIATDDAIACIEDCETPTADTAVARDAEQPRSNLPAEPEDAPRAKLMRPGHWVLQVAGG